MPRTAMVLSAFGVLCLAAPAPGAVWKRVRPDGTSEFTNIPPEGKEWKRVKGAGGPERSSAPPVRESASRPAAPAAAARTGSAIWGRENEDGTLEFTNLNPVGSRWRVLYRTGPGKAASTRGPSDLVPARDRSAARFSRYDEHIRDQQAYYGIPQAFVRAVIKVESDYDPHVVSSAGCLGLMQLMPETARRMGVTDIWDPRQNIMGGSRYLQVLAQRFCRTPARQGAPGFMCSPEELVRVIAGYHAGPGAVDKYGGMPPYETTRAYVTNVLQRYEEYRHREGSSRDGSTLAAQP
jgi:soluble lytic murein transglycosylase-like protein